MAVALAGRPSLDERTRSGLAARQRINPSALGELASARDRPDPLEVLQADAATRCAAFAATRHGRMLASPLAFMRGAVAVMAMDLARSPSSGLDVQLCGDAHVSNFGSLTAADGRPVFGIVDFDETARGPFEWDVKRLVASLAVAAADRPWRSRATRRALVAAGGAYRWTMRRCAGAPPATAPRELRRPDGRQAPATAWLRDLPLAEATPCADGVGAPAWVLRSQEPGAAGPVALQVKAARPPALGLYLRGPEWPQQSRRIVDGQRVLQEASDVFLAPASALGPDGERRDCYVRRLRQQEDRPPVERMSPNQLVAFAISCASALAAAHARSADAVAITAYLGSGTGFDEAMAEFAAEYAAATAHDHGMFEYGVRVGAVAALPVEAPDDLGS